MQMINILHVWHRRKETLETCIMVYIYVIVLSKNTFRAKKCSGHFNILKRKKTAQLKKNEKAYQHVGFNNTFPTYL